MEEISLEDKPITTTTSASKSNDLKTRSRYKKIIKRAFIEFQEQLNSETSKWTIIQPPGEPEKIKLYEKECRDGRYLLKAIGILNAPPHRVLSLNIDHNYETRKQWDNDDLGGIDQHQQFDCGKHHGVIRLVQSWIKMPRMATCLGFYHRDFLGLEWDRYNAAKKTYTMIFQTLDDHPVFKCPSDRTPASGLTGLWIKELDNPNQCYCVMLAYVDIGGSIPEAIKSVLVKTYKEKLRKRLHLYEHVCKPDVWNEIYKPRTSPRRPPEKTIE